MLDFLFSVKASRYITHNKKLKTDDDSLSLFLERAQKLKEKMGPILFQLPPGWKVNAERLAEFLSKLPKKNRYVFELRNETWFDQSIYHLLRDYNCAFCIYDFNRILTPLIITADFFYLRLHGPGEKYRGSYTNKRLKLWSKTISGWQKQGLDVYVYFDNDEAGYAVFNALTLKGLLE